MLDMITKLRQCINLIGDYGWTDSIYTHCSYQIDDSCYIVNSAEKEFTEVTDDDILIVDLETNEIISPHAKEVINPAALIIHQVIHQNRPDMRCVIHTHSTHGVAFSSRNVILHPYNQLSARFHERVSYYPYQGIVDSTTEQEKLLQYLKSDSIALVLENHGLVVGAPTIEATFNDIYLLERSCEIQNIIDSCDNGRILHDDVVRKTRDQFEAFPEPGKREWKARLQRFNR